jgi:ribonuclease-3
MGPAEELARRLGLPVRDFAIVEQALVHSSYLHEHPETARAHNERLEFLGDSIVNAIISEALFARHPRDDEGSLSARRAAIVSTTGLSRLASRIDLGASLLLGEGEAMRGGRRRPSLLASAFEALVGAVYLDLGYEATRGWLLELAAVDIEADQPIGVLKSPKSRLQEYTQRRTGARPMYRIVEATGPDHEKRFRIEVMVGDRVIGTGEGPSRRIAETAAAAKAIERLREENDTDKAVADPVAPGPDGAVGPFGEAAAAESDAASAARPRDVSGAR